MESPELFLDGSFGVGLQQISPEMKLCEMKNAETFPIEDLLDFSNEDASDMIDAARGSSSVDSYTVTASETGGSCNSSFCGDVHNLTESHLGDICVPYEDLPELEWLSNFVEDSFSGEDFQKLPVVTEMKEKDESAESGDYKFSPDASSESSETAVRPNSSFNPTLLVPARARSKRPRAPASNWSSSLVALSTEEMGETIRPVPMKAGRKRELVDNPEGRKCLHCATDKTPQWRTGPLGPKTLCNACGVRYKSGRLVPEYRPAASPTFVLTKHSNSHRKVLELRRQKELQAPQQQFLEDSTGLLNVSSGIQTADEFLIHNAPDFRQPV